MTTTRITTRRLEELLEVLLPTDWAMLGMATRLHLVTGDQLIRVIWPLATAADQRAARRALLRLTEWRVLARLERRMGGLGRGSASFTYAPDVAGHRLLAMRGSARRPHLPRPAMWRHALTVAETYALLQECVHDTELSVRRWEGEPECWRRFTAANGERVIVKPDAHVVVQGVGYSDLFFLEADTGSQSRTVIRAKLSAYRRLASSGVVQHAEDGVFPAVVFVTTTTARHGVLAALIEELPEAARRMFAVTLVQDAGRLLSGEVDS